MSVHALPGSEPDVCPENENGHTPDLTTITVSQDGESIYIDVNCADCGRSGCISMFDKEHLPEIDW